MLHVTPTAVRGVLQGGCGGQLWRVWWTEQVQVRARMHGCGRLLRWCWCSVGGVCNHLHTDTASNALCLSPCSSTIMAGIDPLLVATFTPARLAAAVGVPESAVVNLQVTRDPAGRRVLQTNASGGASARLSFSIITSSVSPGLSSESLLGRLFLSNLSGLRAPVVDRQPGPWQCSSPGKSMRAKSLVLPQQKAC